MDILSDLLRESGLRRRLLDVHAVPDGRALRFPCARSVGFHVVLEGTLYIHTDGDALPLRLEAGDVAVMGRGCHHLLTTCERAAGVPVDDLTAPEHGVRRHEGHGHTRVVSGAYQLWNTPLHPFFAEWPAWHVVRASRTATLEPLQLGVAMLSAEMQADHMGRETVVYGLLDVLFTHLLRDIAAQRATLGAGFSQAVRDPQVRQAVALMHAHCARDWTLESLAREVGMSRSVLAERFRGVMNDTPLSYLRTVRLQRAMRLLAEADASLEQIAAQVGYNDPFGFSKAFKRATGMSPGEFRKRNAVDRELSWRFGDRDVVASG
jgi:AraC-like DNA-binding protein